MAFRRSALYFAILSMSLVANSSVAAWPLPLPELTDEDDPPALGITFSFRDVRTVARPAPVAASRLAALAEPGLLPLLLPLLLLMLIACALSASFSWHIMFSSRLMGVDSGPKKSDMVLERVFRNASCRFSDDLYGGLARAPDVAANADGVDDCWWDEADGE